MEIAKILKDKGYNVIACEPNVDKDKVNDLTLYDLDKIIEESDYLILAQGHKEFKENIEKLKKCRIYDCLGLIK